MDNNGENNILLIFCFILMDENAYIPLNMTPFAIIYIHMQKEILFFRKNYLKTIDKNYVKALSAFLSAMNVNHEAVSFINDLHNKMIKFCKFGSVTFL